VTATRRKILIALVAACGLGVWTLTFLPGIALGEPSAGGGTTVAESPAVAAAGDTVGDDRPPLPPHPGLDRPSGFKKAGLDSLGPRAGFAKQGKPGIAPTQEQIEEAMAFLKQHWPERYAMLEDMRTADPDAFSRLSRNMWPQVVRLMDLSLRNPELAEVEMSLVKLEFDIHEALRHVHRARDKGDSQEAEARLKELIGRRFDLEIRRTELNIQELEERLNQQKQHVEIRRQDKEAQVSRMFQEMLKNPSPRLGRKSGMGPKPPLEKQSPEWRHGPGKGGQNAPVHPPRARPAPSGPTG